jgi:hypothetical protein
MANADIDYLAGVEGKLSTQCSMEPSRCNAIVGAFNDAVEKRLVKCSEQR